MIYKGKRFKKDVKVKKIWKILIVIISVVLVCSIGLGVKFAINKNSEIEAFTLDLEGKQPEEFTLEDYQELTAEEKEIFPDYFESLDKYNEWYESIQTYEEWDDLFTIDLKGKQPEEFTWEDYQELTVEEKEVFPDYFESYDAYQKWYESVSAN